MKRLIIFLEKYEKALKAIAAITVALASSSWAVITLIYPDIIRPALHPGQVELTISSELATQTGDYSLYTAGIDVKNSGLNRIFLPSTYCLARAFHLTRNLGSEKSAEPELTADQKAIIKKVINDLSPEERRAVKSQASNSIFIKRWNHTLSEGNLRGQQDLRSMYAFDRTSMLYVQLSRLTGLHSYLEPGELTSDQILIAIPVGYHVAEITCRTVGTKEKIEDYVFVPAPYPEGLVLLPLKKTEDFQNQVLNFRDTVSKNLESGFYDDFENSMPKSAFFESNRIQFPLPATQ